jgi:hypothetical protein
MRIVSPAMTVVVETEQGQAGVVDSFITLTVANSRGQFMRVRRWAKSLEVSQNLVQVQVADSEEGLATAHRQGMFVRQGGATTSESDSIGYLKTSSVGPCRWYLTTRV